jgi:hypothetical protein
MAKILLTANKVTAWIGERIRELAQIPVNLVRDFPVRLGRVLGLGIAGISTLLNLPAQLSQQPHKTILLRNQIRPFLAWGHRLNVALFDLIGLPEVCQFLMHLVMPTTPLTPT